MEEVLDKWLSKAKKKIDEDEKVKADLKDFDGIFQLRITDGDNYYVEIRGGDVGDLIKGAVESPRLTITSDKETLSAVMSGEMGPMKAFALRKIKLDGSFEDIIRLRRFLKTD